MTKHRVISQLLACLLLTSSAGAQQESGPQAGPRPLVVMTESTMAHGTHPRVVLYEDGQLIFVKEARNVGDALPKQVIYQRVKLDQREVEQFVQRAGEAMADVKPRYHLVWATDFPEIDLYVSKGERQTITWIYGLHEPGSDERFRRSLEDFRRKHQQPAPASRPGVSPFDVLPDRLRELHQWLWELDYQGSAMWTRPPGAFPGEHIWEAAQANRHRESPSTQLFYAEDGLLWRHGEEEPAGGRVVDRYRGGEVEREIILQAGKIVGEMREYHRDGQLALSAHYENGRQHGPYVEYDHRGTPIKAGQFVKGLAQGSWQEFDTRGTLRHDYEMVDGRKHGLERVYNGHAQLIKEHWYERGELVRTQVHNPH
jgi:antitoxin component YwqK of YwqJK toxin-antitoxin module